MYFKLAVRNVKKSFRDYAIYFLTLMFGVCVFYVFNSIDGQQSMMVLTESEAVVIEDLQTAMSYISVFVSVILGLLIVYANRFLVRRRKKELAIYQLLGMEKGQISRILTIETLLVASVSLAAGLALGIFVSQGFAVLTASLFEVRLAEFKFVFSSPAMMKAILYFSIAFASVIVFNRIAVDRQKIIDLLYAERKNEKHAMPPLFLSVVIFIASAGCLGTAYRLIEKEGVRMNDAILLTAIILGAMGTLLFFFSLSGFFLKAVQQNKKIYFKGLNMFVLRQINSKINTAFVSISMVCLMLFLSICAMSFGMGLSKTLTSDLERLHPYDVTYTLLLSDGEAAGEITDPTAISVNMIEELNRLEIPVSAYAQSIVEVTMREVPVDAAGDNEMMSGNYMMLSDYNKLLEMQGRLPIALSDNEFIFNCIQKEHRDEYTDYLTSNTVTLFDAELAFKQVESAVLYNNDITGAVSCVYILPDRLLEGSPVSSRILAIHYKQQTHEYRDLRVKATDAMLENLKSTFQTPQNTSTFYGSSSDRIDNFAESKSTAVTFTYIAVYLGIVFSVISAVVLAIAQLSEASDNSSRYGLLRKLGTDSKMINKALFRQIAIYFGVPLMLAAVHSVFGIRFANALIEITGKASALRESFITAAFILTIYGGYFFATYFGSKRIISS